MKLGKILVVATLAVSLLTTSLAFAGVQPSTEKGNSSQVTAQETKISWSKAKSIFMKRVPTATLKYMRSATDDNDNGTMVPVFMGKGTRGSYVYSFEINALTGKFREFEGEYEGSRTTAAKIGSSFDKSDAKAKVLKKIPGGSIIYLKLTKDDGRWVYEGEAYRNGYEYSFELSAFSGRIYEWEKDWAFS